MTYDVLCTDRDEALWKAHRWEGLSASVIPTLLGMVRYDKRTDAERIEQYAQRIDTFEGNSSAEAGRRLEPALLEWAADLGLVHRETLSSPHELLRSREWPWLMATPDARDRDGLIEVKTHSVYTDKDWKDGVPDYYRAQVLVQMAVTGERRARVLRWRYGIEPVAIPVTATDAEVRAVVSAASKVWDRIKAMREESGL